MVENESWTEFVQKLTIIICDGQMWTGRLSPVWPPTSQDGQRWIFKRNPNQRPRWQGGLHLKPCGRTRLQDRQSRKLRFLWRIARTTTARNPLSRTSKRSLTLRVSAHDERESEKLGFFSKSFSPLIKTLDWDIGQCGIFYYYQFCWPLTMEGTSPLTLSRGQNIFQIQEILMMMILSLHSHLKQHNRLILIIIKITGWLKVYYFQPLEETFQEDKFLQDFVKCKKCLDFMTSLKLNALRW